MEIYFTIGQVFFEAFVGYILMNIVSRQLNKSKQ